MTFRSAVVALALLALPAFAKSEKSRVVQKALRHSVRVEVLVRGKVERAASGVVVATEGDTSYVLTNEHVVQREGLSGNASFQVVVERPKLRRLSARPYGAPTTTTSSPTSTCSSAASCTGLSASP